MTSLLSELKNLGHWLLDCLIDIAVNSGLFHRDRFSEIFREMLNILFEWSLFSDVSFIENQPRKTLLSYALTQIYMYLWIVDTIM